MNLYAERSSNIRRTWILVSGFLIVVVAIGYVISWYYGNPAVLFLAIIINFQINSVPAVVHQTFGFDSQGRTVGTNKPAYASDQGMGGIGRKTGIITK